MSKRISIFMSFSRINIFILFSISCNSTNNNTTEKTTIVIQNYYYAKPGKEKEVLQWRIHACEVLREIGVRPGRVVKCIPGEDPASPEDLPTVIWIGEYPDEQTLNREWDLVRSTGKFEPVMEHMGTLVRDFRRIRSEVEYYAR